MITIEVGAVLIIRVGSVVLVVLVEAFFFLLITFLVLIKLLLPLSELFLLL